jgi:hypothetical protein
MTLILAPVPSLDHEGIPLCRPPGPIKGKVVGLRRDNFWVSWDYVTDEWARLLEQDGAQPVIWRAPIGKGDKEVVVGGEEYEKFLEQIDVAVMGLCNCGSCTIWAVHDTVGALRRDIPTVTVCTEHFEPLVRMLASQRGYANLRLKLLPYPLEGRAESEVREIAREHYGTLLETLGAVR